MADVFAEIRERVPIAEAFAIYGLHPNRAGFVSCPFHIEKTSSLKLYADSWFCFGCQLGGDVVKLVERVEGLRPIDAARRIYADFDLGLFPDRPLTTAERTQAHATRKRREANRARLRDFDAWELWAANTIVSYLTHLDYWRWFYAPALPEDQWHPKFCEALPDIDKWEAVYVDVFVDGTYADKVNFWKKHQGEVTQIARIADAKSKIGNVG